MRPVRRSRPLYGLLLAVLLAAVLVLPQGAAQGSQPGQGDSPANGEALLYLPVVMNQAPWLSPFSVESNRKIADALLDHAQALGTGWMRMHRVYWNEIQPVEQAGYDWSALQDFDDEARALAGTGITPIVIVHQSPYWATVGGTSCAAIRADKFQAFAAFMEALVRRYSQPEFDVHYWELGNEPDVDPGAVTTDCVFGCWGDPDDPYYGGRHYGEMLKVVVPAMRRADPRVKVLIGGLLLDRPVSLEPGPNKPALFFKGILEAGAAPYFDIVPYHAYPSYLGYDTLDYDTKVGHWVSWGGWTLGKARFLRSIMAEYGVDKPLFLDETALGCNPDQYYACDPPPDRFYEAQADYLVRTFTRAMSENIGGLTWFTLDSPGWREGGLLDWGNQPRPAYIAYQQLIDQLSYSRYEGPVSYGPAVEGDIEGYSFVSGERRIQVVWSSRNSATPYVIHVPQTELHQAYDRDGNPLSPTPTGSDYAIAVGFSPLYLELKR